MAETAERKAWEQLEGEPNEAYARFLVYRNLGRARSLDAAFRLDIGKATKGNKRQQAPGQWGGDSVQWNWVERATAWDIEMLTLHGEAVVLDFIAAMRNYASKTLHASLRERLTPRDWGELTNAINTLGKFIPADTVAAIQDTAAEGKEPAIGNVGNNST